MEESSMKSMHSLESKIGLSVEENSTSEDEARNRKSYIRRRSAEADGNDNQCHQTWDSPLDSYSIGVNFHKRKAASEIFSTPIMIPLMTVSNPFEGSIEGGDNSEIIVCQRIDETSPEPNGPSQTSNIQHSDCDTAIRETILRLKKLKEKKEVAQRSIPCIYKIPDELHALKRSAYKPRVVSIGPIHSNNTRLNANKPIKLSYRDSLCSRIKGDECMSETMELCRSAMKELEANVEKCYAEKVKLIRNNKKQISLAEMMLIDGCFILELLYKFYSIKEKLLKRSIEDPVFSSLMRLLAIRHNLLLLENQIPFFVLEKLFSLTVECIPDGPHNVSLTHYVLSFFGNNFSFGNDTLRKKVDTSDCYHILHLLHKCYLPNHDPWEGEKDETEFPKSGSDHRKKIDTSDYHIRDLLHKCYLPCHDPWKGEKDETESHKLGKKKFRFPSASDLDLAGVEFVAGTGEDMFNVKFIKPRGLLRWFRRARFEIPTLSIYDGTEPLLRNLIAFEQCCPAVPRHMTSYGSFMDTLINSAEDVKLLENAEILHNYLGTSEEASNLFNNICKEVVVGRFYFEKTCEAAGNHCREPWPRFLASLRRDYFANPWTGIAVFAAIFIFRGDSAPESGGPESPLFPFLVKKKKKKRKKKTVSIKGN